MSPLTNKDIKLAKGLIEDKDSDVTDYLVEKLIDEVMGRLKASNATVDQRFFELFRAFLTDTFGLILKSYRAHGKVELSVVGEFILKKHKNLFKALGVDHAACGLAVADLILTISTTAPRMVAGVNAAVLVSGMTTVTGGAGLPFMVGSWSLVALSGLSIYLTASQTAQTCSKSISSLADSYSESAGYRLAKPASRLPLRCELPVQQYTQNIFYLLNTSLQSNHHHLTSARLP